MHYIENMTIKMEILDQTNLPI